MRPFCIPRCLETSHLPFYFPPPLILGSFFGNDNRFAGEDKVGGPTEFRNGKLLLVLPLLIPRFSWASALHIENFSKNLAQEPYFLTQ